MSDYFKGSHPIGEDLFKQVLVLWVLVLNHLGFILNRYCFFLSFLFAMGLFFWNIQGAASLSVREISRTWIEIGGCGPWKQVGWQAWRRGRGRFDVLVVGGDFTWCVYVHPEIWGRWTHFDEYFQWCFWFVFFFSLTAAWVVSGGAPWTTHEIWRSIIHYHADKRKIWLT